MYCDKKHRFCRLFYVADVNLWPARGKSVDPSSWVIFYNTRSLDTASGCADARAPGGSRQRLGDDLRPR